MRPSITTVAHGGPRPPGGSGTPEDPYTDFPGGYPSVVPLGGGGDFPELPLDPAGGGPVDITAEEYGPLTDLQKRYTGALDEFDPETDKQAIKLAQDIRDLSSGQRSERLANYASRGLRGPGGKDVSDLLETQASTEATRSAGRAMADYRAARAGQKLGAIRGGLPVIGAPAEMAFREKMFTAQLRESEANRAMMQANQTLNQYLALLSANRTSPMYDEKTAPLTGRGGGSIGMVRSLKGGLGGPRRPASAFM